MGEQVFVHGPIRIACQDRNEGVVIRVFVRDGIQALKFDCFRQGAHYHVDPDGRNDVYPIHEANPLKWASDTIRERLGQLLAVAGHEDAAADLDRQGVSEQVEGFLDALCGGRR